MCEQKAGNAGNASRAGTGLRLKPCLRLLYAMGSLCKWLWLSAMERNVEHALGFPSFLPSMGMQRAWAGLQHSAGIQMMKVAAACR